MFALPPIASTTLTALPELAAIPAPHPYAISSDGAIVIGGFSPANGFIYRPSGKLSRFAPQGRNVYPNAVSTNGAIVGVDKNAFLFQNGQLVTLKPLAGDSASVASAVSPDGTFAAGYSQSENGQFHAILWRGATPRQIETPVGYPDGHVRGLALRAQVAVGVAYDGNRNVRAFSWGEFGGTTLLPIPTWAKESAADAVTPDGRFAVGYVASRSRTRPAFWTIGSPVKVLPSNDVHNGPSAALCIDPEGKWIGGYSGERATLWTSAGENVDLASLLGPKAAGWKFDQISGIGRSGRKLVLCGWGRRNGRNAGFVATFRQ